jgi:hypothetical protein
MNRRNVVLFLALMGIFVTFTQAYTINLIETNTVANSLLRYTGPESYLTTYEAKPLGKNQMLGTLTVKNQLGVTVTASIAVIPMNSSEKSIEIGTTSTYQYKIGTGTWSTQSYDDPVFMEAVQEVSISAGQTKTLYFIFEKSNLAVDYYITSIVIQQKGIA